MKLECPQCKSPVARERQRFCYRCGHELTAYYDSLDAGKKLSGDLAPAATDQPSSAGQNGAPPPATEPGKESEQTPVIAAADKPAEVNPLDITLETVRPSAAAEQKATLRILLPTGDVFDRELTHVETQMGKGPRNEIVIADPAVSATHALIKFEAGGYTITDLGSRNGTYINGDRISEPHKLQHGDVIGMGLSKLTFRIAGYSETGAIQATDILPAMHPTTPPPPLTEESLAQAVVDDGLLGRSDVERLRAAKGRRLYQAIIAEHPALEQSLRDLMSRTFKIPIIDLRAASLDESVAADFPSSIARQHALFPISINSGHLIAAVADPTDTAGVERIRREMRLSVELRLATATEINEQINLHYGPKLIGVLPSGEKLEYLINQHEVEIGKAPHNHIVITDPTVSNTHAIILVRDGGYSIVDLGSRNGTFVNGERLTTHARTLRHGDSIQLGQSVLTFRNPAETTENITATLSVEALAEVRKRAGVPDQAQSEAEPGRESASRESAKRESASRESARRESARRESAPAALPAAPEIDRPRAVATPEAAPAAALAADSSASDEEKKKKKKKKKKGEEERVKAAYIRAVGGILATILSVALTVMLTIILTRQQSNPGSAPPPPSSGTATERSKFLNPTAPVAFSGGTFESSGAAHIPGTDSILFVADSSKDTVFLMQLDQSGNQAGAVKPVPLGASIADPEAITYGGSFFYVVGSQSDPKDGQENALARFSFDAASQSVQGQPEVIKDLRSFLIANVPELRGEGEKKGVDGGLNIEGIAWDPVQERLLLGLRSPQVNGNALLIPIKLNDPRGPFSVENLALAQPNAVQLPLGGAGIRDIVYDRLLKSFLIIAGAPETVKRTDFKLWSWSGEGDQSRAGARPREEAILNQEIKPEGVTPMRLGGRDFLLVVGDASSYFKLDYSGE